MGLKAVGMDRDMLLEDCDAFGTFGQAPLSCESSVQPAVLIVWKTRVWKRMAEKAPVRLGSAVTPAFLWHKQRHLITNPNKLQANTTISMMIDSRV